MKSYQYILGCSIFLILIAGCKKESFDPTVMTREDFTGTWKGTITTFKNNKLMVANSAVTFYPDAGTGLLTGVLFMTETHVCHEFQFVDGTVYFKVDNNDPANPDCQNWDLSGFAVFSAEGEVDITISGNECGQLGNEFVNWEGTLKTAGSDPAAVRYYNFARPGNSWTFKAQLLGGDSCQLQKQVDGMPFEYIFHGSTSQTCGWGSEVNGFTWNVTPSAFSVMVDSTICNKPVTFPINAKPGVVYSSYINNDTVTVTLIDTNLMISVPAGVFPCVRFKYTEPVYAGNLKTTRLVYLWLNNNYGILRQEVSNPGNLGDLHVLELVAKNF